MKSNILVFLIQFLILYVQYNVVAKPIIGNNVVQVNNNDFDSVVCIVELEHNITMQFRDDISCTGTLISLNHVLTAEHCAANINNRRVQIIIGSVDVRLGARYDLMWWITHKQWAIRNHLRTRYRENDISIIRLLRLMTEPVLPAVISTAKKRTLFGLNAKIAGWGLLNNGESPLNLHSAETTIITDSDCACLPSRFGDTNSFFSIGEMCSFAQPYVLLESGDSGGPLLIGNTIVGVNLGTFPRNNNVVSPEQVNIHSSVYFYRNFINNNLEM